MSSGWRAKPADPLGMILCMGPSWGVEMPPIALGVLKTATSAQGINLRTRDLNLETWLALGNSYGPEFWDKSNLHYWTNSRIYAEVLFPVLDPLLEKFSDELAYGPEQILCFTILSSTVLFTNQLVERIRLKVPDKIIVAGGPCLSFHEERARLRKDFDYYIVGEGEETMAELYRYINECQRTLPRSVYTTTEPGRDLPFRKMADAARYGVPDYSDLQLGRYELNALPVIFTRSCLFKCRFCADYVSMGEFRKTSAERIYENLSAFLDMGYASFWFNDLLINGIVKELVEVCLRMEDEGRKFEWIALATPNRQLQSEDLQVLARNGLKTLNFGLESGSAKVMRLMHKGFSLEQAEAGLARVRAAGINTQINIIVGFPGETEEDFLETLNFFERNQASISGFTSVNACVLLPGADICRNQEKYGIVIPPGRDMQTEWEIPNENTPAIRRDRLRRLIQWIHEHGYAIYSHNKNST